MALLTLHPMSIGIGSVQKMFVFLRTRVVLRCILFSLGSSTPQLYNDTLSLVIVKIVNVNNFLNFTHENKKIQLFS